MKSNWVKGCLAFSLVLAGACGGGSGMVDERTDSTESAIGAVPSFLKMMRADWACGEAISGQFTGTDSAHAFTFPLKRGVRYTFDFHGDYPKNLGVAVGLYEARTGRRVAIERQPAQNESVISFVAPADGDYIIGAYSLANAAEGSYSLRAACEIPGLGDVIAGQRSFTSYELVSQAIRDVATSLIPEEAVGLSETGAPGRVEAADIHRIEGDRLFYLNAYRGLMIFDIKDPKAPKLLSRMSISGEPVEMYVQNNVIYALVRNVSSITAKPGTFGLEKKNVSQLVAINIADIRQPKIEKTIDVEGAIREGVSRKVGNALYVVATKTSGPMTVAGAPSLGTEELWAYSFNIASPSDMRLVERIRITEGVRRDISSAAPGSQAARSFDNATISTAGDKLMVVENWRTRGQVAGATYACATPQDLPEAVVSILDLSDPSGHIKMGSHFQTYGQIGEEFKQTLVQNPQSGKSTYIGIFSRPEWQNQNCTGTKRIENTLETWDVTNVASPQRLGKVVVGEPNVTLRGSLFDVQRKLVLAIPSESRAPMIAVSFEDLAHPRVVKALPGVGGDLGVIRFVGDKQFVLTVGKDETGACAGFDNATRGFSSNTAASLLDVQNLDKMRLVQRQCIALREPSLATSPVEFSLEDVGKNVAIQELGRQGLIMLPVGMSRSVSLEGMTGQRQQSVLGLVSFDLTRYDPAREEQRQNVLESLGSIVHPEGNVTASSIVELGQAAPGMPATRELVSLSDTQLALTNISDIAHPMTDATVELAPFVGDVLRFGEFAVEHVRKGTETESISEFRIRPIGSLNEQQPAAAQFQVPDVQRVIKFKDALVLFRRVQEQSAVGRIRPLEAQTEVVVYDMTNPKTPVKAGSALLPIASVPEARLAEGVRDLRAQQATSDFVRTENGIILLDARPSAGPFVTGPKLISVNLSNIEAPKVETRELAQAGTRTYLSLVQDPAHPEAVYVTYKDTTGRETIAGNAFDVVKYQAQRWVQGEVGLAKGQPVSLPGNLIGITEQGNVHNMVVRSTSLERARNDALRPLIRLDLLSERAGVAELLDSKKLFGMQAGTAAIEGQKLVVDAMMNPMALRPGEKMATDELAIFDLSDISLHRTFRAPIGIQGTRILASKEGALFLNVVGEGVVLLDVRNTEQPRALNFVKTSGDVSQIETVGNKAFVAGGRLGILELEMPIMAIAPSEER